MNVKKQNKISTDGAEIRILCEENNNIREILLKNRHKEIPSEKVFFSGGLEDMHDPFLMPDAQKAVERIFFAIENHERIVVFGDYDVDGVSSTAALVKFLHEELGAKISYRLPHRVHDGYGLKNYFFDDLKEKNVTLVITVDCGTRDIEPIRYAKSLGIDVIVTDHHAVPDEIPQEVIGILNPKRRDVNPPYPFPQLAGAGVVFKLIHAILLTLEKQQKITKKETENILKKYIDIVALGTVADCMPLVDENRIITTLGLKQMPNSSSAGIKKFYENSPKNTNDASIIGFQIGPRINAAWRMDTPIIALQWLLASENTEGKFFEKLENLNADRQNVVKDFLQKALQSVNPKNPILFFYDENLEHGLIGLVAGKITEKFNRLSVVLCPHYEHDGSISYVASCRAPEWADLMPILDASKNLFLRYGGHKQAAGFSILPENFETLQTSMIRTFHEIFGENIPARSINVEAKIDPYQIDEYFLEQIEPFKPFGIANSEPLWLMENLTISEVQKLGKEKKHRKIFVKENPTLPFLMWGGGAYDEYFQPEKTISLVVTVTENIWNGKKTAQAMIKHILKNPD